MKLISHRGNTTERKPDLENHPDYIMDAYKSGFNVEIDVWNIEGEFYLGHDEPTYQVDWKFLIRHGFWCHAKNFEALHRMRHCGAHCFWHQEDEYTLTSEGFIWTYPGKKIGSQSVIVCKTEKETIDACKQRLYGICSDFIGVLK